MRALGAGFRLQLLFYRNYPDTIIPVLTAPLFTVVFLLIVRSNGRTDLSAYAVVAPMFMSLWWFALYHGGWVIQTERWSGTIELLFAAPVSFPLVVCGRILAVTFAGLLSFPEVWLVARYVLGVELTVYHPWVLAVTLAATAFAMAATALAMAGLFVLARNAVTFSNSASYPFYVLGGIIVPISLLPGWLQPVSNAVFLSWSVDLVRASTVAATVPDVPYRITMILVLGVVGLLIGVATLIPILRRVRTTGELSFQ